MRDIKRISHDIELTYLLKAEGSKELSALDIQYLFLEAAQDYVLKGGGEVVGGDEIAKQILERWENTLEGLSQDPLSLYKTVDWIAKYRIFKEYIVFYHCQYQCSCTEL